MLLIIENWSSSSDSTYPSSFLWACSLLRGKRGLSKWTSSSLESLSMKLLWVECLKESDQGGSQTGKEGVKWRALVALRAIRGKEGLDQKQVSSVSSSIGSLPLTWKSSIGPTPPSSQKESSLYPWPPSPMAGLVSENTSELHPQRHKRHGDEMSLIHTKMGWILWRTKNPRSV